MLEVLQGCSRFVFAKGSLRIDSILTAPEPLLLSWQIVGFDEHLYGIRLTPGVTAGLVATALRQMALAAVHTNDDLYTSISPRDGSCASSHKSLQFQTEPMLWLSRLSVMFRHRPRECLSADSGL